MPVVGGAVTTLVASTQVSRISLHGSYLYYAEGKRISRVLGTGGPAAALFYTPDVVTALHVTGGPQYAFLFWGEAGGAVRSSGLSGTFQSTLLNPTAGRRLKSVGFDGIYVLAIDCVEPGESTCNVRMFANTGTVTLNAGVGADCLQWDANNVFWTDVNSVKRYAH